MCKELRAVAQSPVRGILVLESATPLRFVRLEFLTVQLLKQNVPTIRCERPGRSRNLHMPEDSEVGRPVAASTF
jgi:hypothetical protein